MTAARFWRANLAVATWLCLVTAGTISRAADTRVDFDIPDTIECRDTTPKDFAEAHPTLKVIEAKFRVSARFIEGAETDVVDFLYMVTSPGLHLKIQDYLPNTTLESTVADDRIEVTAATEDSDQTNADAHVAYKVLSLGGTKSETAKKSKSDHYKEIVSKSVVLSSGTMNREHGVFFKFRPSKDASLEGSKTFTFLAIVSKEWRGDWCVISCAARANKKSFFSTKVAPAGIGIAHVGMYLAGDREARFRAEEFYEAQEAGGGIIYSSLTQHAGALVDEMHAATTTDDRVGNWLHSIFSSLVGPETADVPLDTDPDSLQKKFTIQKEMANVEQSLSRLSGARF